MKKLSILCLMIAASIFMVTNVYAAGAQIGKGSSEVFGMLSYTNTVSKTESSDDKNTTNTALYTVGYGYFVTDRVQLGISHLGILAKSDSDSSSDTLSILGFDGFVKYHFLDKGATLVPYVGLQAGYLSAKYNDDKGDAMTYGAMGGLKYFVSENVTLNTELNYRHYDLKSRSSDDKAKSDTIGVLIGFSVYF